MDMTSKTYSTIRETLSDVDNPTDPNFEALRYHYEEGYTERGYPIDPYETAYRYGYFLATDERYRDREWAEIETEVRRNWGSQSKGSWEIFSRAAQEGWNELKRVLR